ncbi:MAG: uL15 family ribosomal protein [Methanobacteriaceae archaeon]|nr:uL15 family ribosomal protein [Methanobacteriaceae archaeon]
MIRTKRKINKMRGSRTIGGGCSKKRRGAGHRGGRGMAGGHKHKWSWIVNNDPDHFGKYGFKRPQKSIKKVNPVNLSYLDENLEQLLEKGLATTENDVIVIDITELGFNKVLGRGKITKPLLIKAPEFSGLAEKKIQEAGGESVTL